MTFSLFLFVTFDNLVKKYVLLCYRHTQSTDSSANKVIYKFDTCESSVVFNHLPDLLLQPLDMFQYFVNKDQL